MARSPATPPDRPADEAADRRRGLALVPVSRETEARLDTYVTLLRRWQSIKNLVGPATLAEIWTRHVADSAQLAALMPNASRWLDMGSGAGFPGLVVAILIRDRPGTMVHLVESNARKCAFLREVARETGAPALVHNGRIEDVAPGLETVDVVTARALAPLPVLLELGKVAFDRGASGLFLKTQDELASVALPHGFRVTTTWPSRTSPEGRIILVQAQERPIGSSSHIAEGMPS